jgi:GDP-4-dehydro-6-deoxy-D-mannose reductase
VKVLVTGADGFVGRRLVPRLVASGHEVTAAVQSRAATFPGAVRVCPLELRDTASVSACAGHGFDGVVHLAAVASGTEARRDPGLAWEVNAAGTARLCEAIAGGQTARAGEVRVLIASTAEVYGIGAAPRPRREDDPLLPCSPYAASKLGAEIAAAEVRRRTGLAVVIARPFPHTGAGQSDRAVVPAFARRLAEARARRARAIPVGNLDPVRDFLHVDDVIEAYVLLLERGEAGAAYNIAGGHGVSIAEVLDRLRRIIGSDVSAVPDPTLMRHADIPHLVGDATKLRERTGWTARRSLDDALAEVARAEAH